MKLREAYENFIMSLITKKTWGGSWRKWYKALKEGKDWEEKFWNIVFRE